MFIAIDDTDSRKGMCTTFLVTEMIAEFEELELLEHPRLVRLNPNVPWKTRGNGAVVINMGSGVEKRKNVGFYRDHIYTYSGKEIKTEDALERAEKVVGRWAEFSQEGTNPGVIVSEEKPPYDIYLRAVRDIVKIEDVEAVLSKMDCDYRGYGNRRGLIGALAAMAWEPRDHTYELITYRDKEKWGTERGLSDEDIIRFDKEAEKTFDSYDHEQMQQTAAPRSPCPVLYGVRGDDPEELKKAIWMIGGETVDRWILFKTNQATDDHIQDSRVEDVKPWTSVHIKGTVTSTPHTIPGGHVFFEIDEKLTAAAYEPTKGFREMIKKLIPGDRLELWGGIREEPITLNIEKMKIIELSEKRIKLANPQCPDCGRRMSSIGKNAGFRCKRCSTRAAEDDIETKIVERGLKEGYYEVPVCARRHLSKPLKRYHSG